MSHYPAHLYPPPGGPPPYGQAPPPYGQAPPPRPPYAYMPAAPVMMPVPVYPPANSYPQPPSAQPTYVTNHIYNQQQPPEPVHVVENAAPPQMDDPIDWVPATTHNADALTYKAVEAGKEPGGNSSPLWVIRAFHSGELIPGKLAVRDRRAYIPHGGREIPVHNFQILCAPAHMVRWLPASHGQVPAGAIPGGNTHNGETLYIGRVKHSRSVTPGKIHPSHGCLYISFGGMEVPHKNYEVLCRIVG